MAPRRLAISESSSFRYGKLNPTLWARVDISGTVSEGERNGLLELTAMTSTPRERHSVCSAISRFSYARTVGQPLPMNTTTVAVDPASEETATRRPSSPRRVWLPRPEAAPELVAGMSELVRELLHDAVGKHIGHSEDLGEDLVEGDHVGVPITLEPCNDLALGEVEMLHQEVGHVGFGPVLRIGSAEQARDLLSVLSPLAVVLSELGVVAGLGGRDQVDRDHDVLLEQPGERLPGGGAVQGDDGVADVFLVLEQAAGSRRGVGRSGHRRDDVFAGPDHMVGPQPAKGQLERYR